MRLSVYMISECRYWRGTKYTTPKYASLAYGLFKSIKETAYTAEALKLRS